MENQTPHSVLFNLMLNSDRQAAVAFVEQILADGATAEFVLKDLLDPALVKQGLLWGQGQMSLAQAYVAAKIAEDILFRCIPLQADGGMVKKRGTIVIGNIEDDFHSLGRKIVATFLKANGWEVHDLGNDVPAAEFVDSAIKLDARIIAASAMMYTTALNIRKIHEELKTRNLTDKIKLAAGGAVFNGRPQLVHEVGADGTAVNAFETVLLMDKLLHQCRQKGAK